MDIYGLFVDRMDNLNLRKINHNEKTRRTQNKLDRTNGWNTQATLSKRLPFVGFWADHIVANSVRLPNLMFLKS